MPTATDPCKRVFSIFTIIIREPQRQIRDKINKIAPIPPSPISKIQGIRGLLVRVTSYWVFGAKQYTKKSYRDLTPVLR